MTIIKTTKASNLIWGLGLTILTALISCGDDDDTPTVTLDPRIQSSTESIAFGEIEAGGTASRSFTLSGRDLSDDVSVALSGDSFSVSLSETDGFGTSVTVTADDINAGDVTIFLQFSSNTEGENTGSISITSELDPITVSLSGTVAAVVVVPETLQWVENFDHSSPWDISNVRYADLAAAQANNTDWLEVRQTGVDPLLTDGLTLADYPDSGVGMAFDGNGASYAETMNIVRTLESFAFEEGDVLYVSFLFNVTAARDGNGTQTVALTQWKDEEGPGVDFRAKVAIKDDGSGNLNIGVEAQQGFSNAVYASGTYSFGTTYNIVMKYETLGSEGTTDKVSLYILDAVTATEPAQADAEDTSNNTYFIDGVLLQSNPAHSSNYAVDGIRIADTWADLF